MSFLPEPLLSENEKLPLVSNPIPYPEYQHLSGSAFLVNLTAPNKEFPNLNLVVSTNNVHKFSS